MAIWLILSLSESTIKLAFSSSKKEIVTIDASYGGLICKNCYRNEQIIDLRVVKLLRMYYYIDIGSIENIKVDAKLKKIINKFLTDYYDSFTGLYLDKKVLEFKE